MNKVIAILLLFIHTQIHADALDYYRYVHKAEMAICNRDLPAAYHFYVQAFKINDSKPFSKDLLNAYYCSMDLKIYDSAIVYLKRILNRGVGRYYVSQLIRSSYKEADLDSINQWLSCMPDDTVKSSGLARAISGVYKTDQATRRYFREKNGNYNNNDSVLKLDEQDGNFLIRLFKKHGIPTIEEIGTMNNSPIAPPMYELIAMHYNCIYRAGKYSHGLDSFLFKGIFTYSYSPETFATIFEESEFTAAHKAFIYKHYRLTAPLGIRYISVWENGNVYPEYLPADQEQKINTERASIGMESLDELRTKLFFRQENIKINNKFTKYILATGFGIVLDAPTYEKAAQQINEFSKFKPG